MWPTPLGEEALSMTTDRLGETGKRHCTGEATMFEYELIRQRNAELRRNAERSRLVGEAVQVRREARRAAAGSRPGVLGRLLGGRGAVRASRPAARTTTRTATEASARLGEC